MLLKGVLGHKQAERMPMFFYLGFVDHWRFWIHFLRSHINLQIIHYEVMSWQRHSITGPLWRESTVHWWFSSQRAINAESISMSWRILSYDSSKTVILLQQNRAQQKPRDHFVTAPSQWKTTSHCNVVSHRLGRYTKWSLKTVCIFYGIYYVLV